MEASTGTFYWADQVEAKGALCFVLDPYKFKIIKDSWNKTDKHDARNMGKAMWVYLVTDEFGIPGGFICLVAIMDWFSRYVLSWGISITLDAQFCVSALERALMAAEPEIFNTDQGSQFTSDAFLSVLEGMDIKISMDGRGRALDNMFVERLWRSLISGIQNSG